MLDYFGLEGLLKKNWAGSDIEDGIA